MHPIIQEIILELQSLADEKIRLSGLRYFKEAVQIHGVKTALVTQLAKKRFKEIATSGKEEIFDLCKILLNTGYMEESFIACHWSHAVRKHFTSSDIALFGNWINQYISNWATCDTFCNHTVGALLEKHPGEVSVLRNWALSENRWMRRASAVSLIVPARKGLFLPDSLKIADLLLTDPDDMVQKGYGWLLKTASQAYPDDVFNYVMANKHRMPRTALRYAIEKMPDERRHLAMQK
jgi:3-methyladenine DNA glycosylase AlkD